MVHETLWYAGLTCSAWPFPSHVLFLGEPWNIPGFEQGSQSPAAETVGASLQIRRKPSLRLSGWVNALDAAHATKLLARPLQLPAAQWESSSTT